MRGFAQTAHCPRCGTAKPTGGDVAPIVTCAECGLGFDPKPRDPARAVALDRVAEGPITVVATDVDTHLVLRDSAFVGAFLLLGGLLLAGLVYIAIGEASWITMAVAAAAAVYAIYGGASRLFGRTYVYITSSLLETWQRPLPRHPHRRIAGELTRVKLEPHDGAFGRDYAIVASADREHRLVTVGAEETARELVAAIHEHRARLGGTVLFPEDVPE